MDNFFQFLIYLIFIIAFLSSIFKKKNKEKPGGTAAGHTSPYKSPELKYPQKSQQDDYDILKEIEGLFRTEIPNPPEKRKFESTIEAAQKRKISDEEHTEDKEEHELDKSWHQITPFKRNVRVDSRIEKEAEQFEHMLENLDKQDDTWSTELRNKLFSPQSLRENIIMMEILGKPKYLRR
jgi:hypothetical protein